MERDALLRQVKRTVQQIDPRAEMILFGSRARGDARQDSDWDFLVLTTLSLSNKNKYAIVDAVFEQVELVTGEVITLILHKKSDRYDKFRITPLFRRIEEDGIVA